MTTRTRAFAAALCALLITALAQGPARADDASAPPPAPLPAPAQPELLPPASQQAPRAPLPAGDEARLERMTDYIVMMLPAGLMFQSAIAKDPTWPLQEKASRVKPEQLACLRDELSVAGFRRMRAADVREHYAGPHADELEGDLKLMDDGAGHTMDIVMAGAMRAAAEGRKYEVDAKAVGALSPRELGAFMEFAQSPDRRRLRVLSGYGEELARAARNGDKNGDSRERGQDVGKAFSARIVFRALDNCHVPLSAIL